MSVPRLSRLELARPLSPTHDGRPRDVRAAPQPRACPTTEAHADAWIDGELSAGTAAALDAHLRSCPSCRSHVEALRRLVAAVRRHGARQPPAPASVRARARELVALWHDEEARAAAEAASPQADRRPGR